MQDRISAFFRRHPLLRDAILWALPALVFGAALRLLFLSYSPLAYWGSDSKSYFNFAYDFISLGSFGLDAKRRFIYPILLLPASLLPGSPLFWVAWLQHGLGVVTLLPLAYSIRKLFIHWRWMIVPVTLFYAGMPVILWYEHELIGETIFIAAIVWMCAGWIAWVGDPRPGRLHWWRFYVPLAVMMLTKPSGRFFWPGIFIALVFVTAWRSLTRKQAISLVVLFLAALGVGKEGQGTRLLYTTAFPLTLLDTPLHADYKAEIRDMVEPLWKNLDKYYVLESEEFLKNPDRQADKPLWQKLDRDEALKSRVYRDLALEGIFARPDLFLYIGLQRIAVSSNPAEFRASRFNEDYFAERFKVTHQQLLADKPELLRFLFAMPKSQDLTVFEDFRKKVSPKSNSRAAVWLQSYIKAFQSVTSLVDIPEKNTDRSFNRLRLTFAGWWLIAGALLSLLPNYRNALGVWTITIVGYLMGVFLFGANNPRYFAPAWPVIALLLCVPGDLLLNLPKLIRQKLVKGRSQA